MGTAPTGPTKDETPPAAVKVGDLVLDRYRVVEHIASGGHSVVFRGTDERLSRPVCIKVFSGIGGRSGLGRTSYEHFVQEAFALSRLTHPNTLRIYDFGHLGATDAGGMPLQVCEYMNGGTLSTIVREQGKQTLTETIRVVSAMCAALAEAHGLGIVHRDIKPQNILFGAVGTIRLPKLADFGIAKWSADETDKENKRAEDTAIVAGEKLAMYSPSWAAPEQLAGQTVSATTDIYSLGVVAIYMLAGKAIFADEDVYAGYKKRRQADELVRESLGPHAIPKRVMDILTKALAFDPKKRIAQVDELASLLAAALEATTEQRARVTPTSISTDVTAEAPVYLPVTPTSPTPSITPPSGLARPAPGPAAPGSAALGPAASTGAPNPPVLPRTTLPVQPPGQLHAEPPALPPLVSPSVLPPILPPVQPPVHPIWVTPVVRPPWMAVAQQATGRPRRLQLVDAPQAVGDRNVHFAMVTNNVVDLVGGQASKVRVTFIGVQSGARVIHLKGLTCFVAHLGGRPSPAVQLEQPGDVALVTPRAEEIGHIRVANGAADGAGHLVFAVGTELVAVHTDDCTDPILFDFGPGSDAYFVYTRGRTAPKTRRR